MFSAVLLLTLSMAQDKPSRPMAPSPTHYRAWLESPGGELPFEFEVVATDRGQATIRNGDEQIVIGHSRFNGDVHLNFDEYDSVIEAKWDSGSSRLKGTWIKNQPSGQPIQMVFQAEPGAGYRFKPNLKLTEDVVSYSPLAGRWVVKFADDKEPAVGIFKELANKVVEGTFLTTTGDYRYLAGSYEFGLLRLSCFDGAHAFLFHANMQPDGTLKGDFWSGPKYHDTWTAKRDDEAALPDEFTLTKVNPKARLKDLKFRDLTGKERSLGEAGLLGKATIIEVFGSWCPNCHDAANLLVALEKKHGSRGLKIMGLAFEATGDLERNAKQVQRYLDRHSATYLVLLAGVKDKAKASSALPVIDGLKGYPTFLFVDGDGAVRSVFTGFSGPATGVEYEKLRARFERCVEDLLRRP